LPRPLETSVVNVVLVILSEIIRDKGWFMSQYLQSLTCSLALRGTFITGPPAWIPSVLAELDMRDGAEGAFGAGPPACIPKVALAGEVQ
jgi:hypothetical protein